MQFKSIAECSKGSILQYFRPSLSYHLSLRPLFVCFLSGGLRQVLLYGKCFKMLNSFLFLFSNEFVVIRAENDTMLVRIANREDTDQNASSEAF